MKILVIGAGTMGAGIAQVMAQAGNEVFLRDIDQEFVDKGINVITKNLEKMVAKDKLTDEEKNGALGRITGILDIADARDVDVSIEAAVEQLDLKQKIFAELDQALKPEAILATNTSSLSITAIAAATGRPDKVVGMHFFNPVPVLSLIEVIRGMTTSDETYHSIVDLSRAIGKDPVTVKEAPGFVVNRILVPMINEAAFILSENVASAEDIDTAMKLGCSHPIGPLALGDLVGLDVCLAIMKVLHTEFGDSKYRPAPILSKLVRAGCLGRKTGRGFFQYR
jgi:3-hydroxybutyryl-CoA dehydrogenase